MEYVAAIVAALVICCACAGPASGYQASWAWGLLGPVGLIIAGLRGIQVRMDAFARTWPAAEEDSPRTRRRVARAAPGARDEE